MYESNTGVHFYPSATPLKHQWKGKSLSCVRLFVTTWTIQSMKFSRPEFWSGYSFPPPGDLPNAGIEPRFSALRWILYQLSHNGSPRMLEEGAYPFSRDLPNSGIKLGSPHCRWILYQLSYQGSNKSKGPNKAVDKGWSISLRSTTPLLIFWSGT